MIRLITFLQKITSKLSFFFDRVSKRFAKASLEFNTMKYHMKFGERDSDIYVVTYPKSGTTLMQMLVYQLTTDGNTDFKHLYDVSPWTDNDAYLDLDPPELPSPRIIKSHRTNKKFDKAMKGKFIIVIRDVYDVMVSQYHQNKNFNDPDLDFDDFFDDFISKEDNWFLHTKDWIENKKRLPVLYVDYAALLNDFETQVKRISEYIGCELNEEILLRTKEKCSFSFMKTREDKYGERHDVRKKNGVYDQFIRKGKVGEGISYFSSSQRIRIEELLRENKIVK